MNLDLKRTALHVTVFLRIRPAGVYSRAAFNGRNTIYLLSTPIFPVSGLSNIQYIVQILLNTLLSITKDKKPDTIKMASTRIRNWHFSYNPCKYWRLTMSVPKFCYWEIHAHWSQYVKKIFSIKECIEGCSSSIDICNNNK